MSHRFLTWVVPLPVGACFWLWDAFKSWILAPRRSVMEDQKGSRSTRPSWASEATSILRWIAGSSVSAVQFCVASGLRASHLDENIQNLLSEISESPCRWNWMSPPEQVILSPVGAWGTFPAGHWTSTEERTVTLLHCIFYCSWKFASLSLHVS